MENTKGTGFETFGTIQIGAAAKEAARIQVGEMARIMMNDGHSFRQGFDIDDLDLLIASVKELTGRDRASTNEIFDGIRKRNCELCLAWVGPELRKKYISQPEGEFVLIAMNPICSHLFMLIHYSHSDEKDGLWLSDQPVKHPNYERHWDGPVRFVFCRRK